MNNITLGELAPIFDAKRRPVLTIKGKENLDALVTENQAFESYTIQPKDIMRFPAYENMEVAIQPVRPLASGEDLAKVPKMALVACELERGGKKKPYWFNVNSLSRRDADNNPVMPFWYELGNLTARLEKLGEVGAITCNKTVSIKATVFDGNKPKREMAIGVDGLMHETGRNATKDVKVNIVEPYTA
jgi:hypothetical protein